MTDTPATQHPESPSPVPGGAGTEAETQVDQAPACELEPRTGRGGGAIVTLAVLGIIAALYAARVVLLPLATAIVLSLVLRPIVRRLAAWHIPHPVGALIIVSLISGGLAGTVYGLSGSAQQWVKEAPHSLRQLRYRIGEIKQPIEDMRKATEEVEELGKVGSDEGTKVVVQNENEGLPTRLMQEFREAAVGILTTLIVLFFMLGWGGRMYRNVVNALPRFANQRRIVAVAQEIEHSVSAYLATVTVINIVLGGVVAGLMYVLGMPNPLLWGAMAGILNFMPYLGPALTAIVLTFVALTTYPVISEALLVPLLFLTITSIEGYVITPMAVGTRLTLNPLVIFVSLMFWFWIWGIIGALLTVPLLVCLKIAAEHLIDREVAHILD